MFRRRRSSAAARTDREDGTGVDRGQNNDSSLEHESSTLEEEEEPIPGPSNWASQFNFYFYTHCKTKLRFSVKELTG